MPTLEPPHSHHLSAAIGWLELGDPSEASAELGKIAPNLLTHPDVLEVRWIIAAEAKNWPAGLEIARSLLHSDPSRSSGWLHLAYALRRVPEGGLQAAFEALRPAIEKFSDEPIIPFNLSCYACQMQRQEEALRWLRQAVRIGGKEKIKGMALLDPDLEPLWGEIGKL